MENRAKLLDEICRNKDLYTIEQLASIVIGHLPNSKIPFDIYLFADVLSIRLLEGNSSNEDILGGMSVGNDGIQVKNDIVSNYAVVTKTLPVNKKRYLITWLLCNYLLDENKDTGYVKVYRESSSLENENTKAAQLARAIMMPQSELSIFIHSPIMKNETEAQIIIQVSKVFLVEESVARKRLEDIAFISR